MRPAPSPPAPPVAAAPFVSEEPKPVSPSPQAVETAMSPVSAPDATAQEETFGEAVRAAVDAALASSRVAQREVEARLGRLEIAIRDLQLADHARAATYAGAMATQGAPPLRPHLPTLPMGAQEPAPPAVFPQAPPPPAPAAPIAPPIANTALVAAAPPAHSSPPVAVAAPKPAYVIPTYDDEPFDMSMLPDGLDGRRRKKMIVSFALVVAVLGLGGLIAMAVASQAVHGL
jgi:hypothetical protein